MAAQEGVSEENAPQDGVEDAQRIGAWIPAMTKAEQDAERQYGGERADALNQDLKRIAAKDQFFACRPEDQDREIENHTAPGEWAAGLEHKMAGAAEQGSKQHESRRASADQQAETEVLTGAASSAKADIG